MKTNVSPKIKAKVSKFVRENFDCHGANFRLGFYFYNLRGDNDFDGEFLDTRNTIIVAVEEIPGYTYNYVYCVNNGKHITIDKFKETIDLFMAEWEWLEVRRYKQCKTIDEFNKRLEYMYKHYQKVGYKGIGISYNKFHDAVVRAIEHERTNRVIKPKKSKSK